MALGILLVNKLHFEMYAITLMYTQTRGPVEVEVKTWCQSYTKNSDNSIL